MSASFLAHLHPAHIDARHLGVAATFGLGIIAIVLIGVLFATGVLLGVHYVPTATAAYDSVIDLEHAVAFGSTIRALHRFAAEALLVVAGLHLLRVLVAAAYTQRRTCYQLGLALYAALFTSAFTGYVLPLDQRAYWGARVVASMLDSLPLLGRLGFAPRDLGMMHALHTTALPMIITALTAMHLWRLRQERRPTLGDVLPARPHLLQRELILTLLVMSALIIAASSWRAPLGAAADLGRPDNPEKAPWYFIGMQELASLVPVELCLLYGLSGVALLVLLPHLDRGGGGKLSPNKQELLAHGLGLGAVTLALVASYALALPAFLPWIIALLAAAATGRALGRRAGLRASLAGWLWLYVLYSIAGTWRGPNWVLGFSG